jgi:hypothetical protein
MEETKNPEAFRSLRFRPNKILVSDRLGGSMYSSFALGCSQVSKGKSHLLL